MRAQGVLAAEVVARKASGAAAAVLLTMAPAILLACASAFLMFGATPIRPERAALFATGHALHLAAAIGDHGAVEA